MIQQKNDTWPRQDGESDDAYFMRVLQLVRTQHPELQGDLEYLLWFGVCDETDLPCLHPWHLREYHSAFFGTRLLKDFIASEPPRSMDDEDYRDRVLGATRCPVCDTRDPKEPVDIRKQRGRMLGLALATAMRRWAKQEKP